MAHDLDLISGLVGAIEWMSGASAFDDAGEARLGWAAIRDGVLYEAQEFMARGGHFEPVEAGEWIRPPLDTPFLMECCDCGLVHALSFDHDETGRIIFAAVRAEPEPQAAASPHPQEGTGQ